MMCAQEEIKVGQFTVAEYTVKRLQSEMFPVLCDTDGRSVIEVDFEKRTIHAYCHYDSGSPEKVWNRRAIWIHVHRGLCSIIMLKSLMFNKIYHKFNGLVDIRSPSLKPSEPAEVMGKVLGRNTVEAL